MGLSSGRPVLVSDSPIFAELQSCCYTMGGASKNDIVHEVVALRERAAQGEQIVGRQNQWLAHRSWQNISGRLANTLMGLLGDIRLTASLKPTLFESPKRFFVDVSELYRRDAKTGIQRVVHSILSELLRSPPLGFEIYPVYSLDGKGYKYTAKFCPDNTRMILWDEQPFDFGKGDIFLGLDLTAHLFPVVEPLLQEMRQAGVQVSYVLYDILPVTHPEYFPPGMSQPFEAWLNGLSRCADHVVAISQHSANAFNQWVSVNAPQSSVRAVFFHLGSEFLPEKLTTGLPDDFASIQKIWNKGTTFIAVGTLEPRKGYGDILDAFEILWAKGILANLVLVGKAGWKTEKLAARIKQHPMNGKRLFWFESASDETLEACYAGSHCLIAASYEEGFGLPIVEALRRGVSVVARDIPVFREIASSDDVSFFSGAGADLADFLNARLDSIKRSDNTSYQFLSWVDSKDQLLSALDLNRD